MALIWHFADISKLEEITESNKLCLEGSLNERGVKEGFAPLHIQTLWISMKEQFDAVGRYVWFTEQDRYAPKSYAPEQKAAIQFDSNDIGARKWHYVCKDLKKSPKNSSSEYNISLINRSAINGNGDDPYKWWVVENEVDLRMSKGIFIYNSETKQYEKTAN